MMINAGVSAKELIDKGVCDKRSIWNPSNCECECDKSYDTGEYLDYENCKCRKKLVDKLVEEYTKNNDEVTIAGMALLEHGNECECSYTVCVVLAVIALTISIGLAAYFACKFMNLNQENVSRYDYVLFIVNIHSVNPLYLMIDEVIGYIEKNNGNNI